MTCRAERGFHSRHSSDGDTLVGTSHSHSHPDSYTTSHLHSQTITTESRRDSIDSSRSLSSEAFSDEDSSPDVSSTFVDKPVREFVDLTLKPGANKSLSRKIVETMAFGALTLGALYMALFAFAEPIDVSPYQVSGSFQQVLSNSSKELYGYPTDLTRNIVPKQLHSHNDYWRDKPFWSALSVGAISIEADVWLYNDTLYVGHESAALTPSRTFQSLYIQPILSVLERQNPSSAFVNEQTHNGVFDTTSDQTLYLWVDCKTEGESTFKAVIKELEPLRAGGWLTNYTGPANPLYSPDQNTTEITATQISQGAITVIGTGNTPLSLVQPVSPRDYFYDANLAFLSSSQSNISSTVSPIASTQFSKQFSLSRSGEFNSTQLDLLNSQIETAKQRGIGARYWDTPGWPLHVRKSVWDTLWGAGVMLVNVDDLEAAAFEF